MHCDREKTETNPLRHPSVIEKEERQAERQAVTANGGGGGGVGGRAGRGGSQTEKQHVSVQTWTVRQTKKERQGEMKRWRGDRDRKRE